MVLDRGPGGVRSCAREFRTYFDTMSAPTTTEIKHVCISHAALRFVPTVPYTFYTPMPLDGIETVVIPDDCLGERYNGRVLSEYLQLFALAEQWTDFDGLIHLFQYRRFLSPNAPRVWKAQVDGGLFVEEATATQLFPAADRYATVNLPTIGPIMRYPIVKQYAIAHPPVDLENLARSMAFSGAFSQADAEEFYNSQLFLVSPSIGIYPASMLCDHIATMRRVWDYFYDHYYVPREGYQRRLGGYLMERLQSYLVLRHFDRNPGTKANVWYRIILDNATRLT